MTSVLNVFLLYFLQLKVKNNNTAVFFTQSKSDEGTFKGLRWDWIDVQFFMFKVALKPSVCCDLPRFIKLHDTILPQNHGSSKPS